MVSDMASSLLLSVWPSQGITSLIPQGDQRLDELRKRVSVGNHQHGAHTTSGAHRQRLHGSSACPRLAWSREPHLLEAALDAAVLAGHHLAVPVLRSPAGEAQVGVALPHRQVARALLRVALGLAAAAGEAVLACVG